MRKHGCDGCELGCQKEFRAPVVFRGNPEAKRMIIGEAPGKDEDKEGLPFVGPAGQLLDKIFLSVGWLTSKDFYLGNVVKCRPVAPASSYKQNLTPTEAHRSKCKPYIEREIDAIQPSVVVLLGKTAAASLLGQVRSQPMYKIAGKVYSRTRWPHTAFFVMYHPAALLHSQAFPDKHKQLREATWKHIQLLKEVAMEYE